MLRLKLTAALIATLPALALAQQPAAVDVEREARVAWLKEHAIALRSIDPADEDFSDLEPLRKAIGDARIVQLGEQQHTDGATLLAKTRLIKFLHQRMGFDVLAFESGLYDCRKAWELLRQGHDPYDSVRQGVFGIWSGTEQFQPLVNYLGQHARGDRPLELCGFDCNFSARGANGRIVEDIKTLLMQLSADGFDDELRETLVTGIESLAKNEPAPEPAVLEQRRRALEAFSKALANQHATHELRTEELAYWRQVAKCIETVMVQRWLSPYRDDDVAGQVRSENRRDAQMAANLVWLAREAFPARKIITWAASSHLSRNRFRLEPVDRKEAEEYKLIRDMGNGVWKELGEETYTVAFLSGEGQLSWGKVPLPAPGSIEDLFQSVGMESGFLDLRKLDDSGQWLRQPVIARPMGYVNRRGDWTSVSTDLYSSARSTLAR